MIEVVQDYIRGCGWRKAGGMYLMGDVPEAPCGMLPIPLTVCPCCGGGIKQSRGWTWVEPHALIRYAINKECEFTHCHICPLRKMYDEELQGRHGLMWAGKQYYTPETFVKEAQKYGVSKRIATIPNDFVVGEHWVLLAHPHAIKPPKLAFGTNPDDPMPGIFMVFKPSRIEYIVKGDETQDELDALEARGLTLVRVERVQDKQDSMGI